MLCSGFEDNDEDLPLVYNYRVDGISLRSLPMPSSVEIYTLSNGGVANFTYQVQDKWGALTTGTFKVRNIFSFLPLKNSCFR